MKSFVRIFLVSVLAILTIGWGQAQAQNTQPASYILSDDNITSWTEHEMGFTIKLTENARKDFLALTRENLKKPISLYVYDFLVSSPVVQSTIGGGSMMLAVDGEMKEKVRSLLPPSKKDSSAD